MSDVSDVQEVKRRKFKKGETTEDFAEQFADLALGLPPSIRKAAVARLKAKNIDPLEPADEKQSEQVVADLEAAIAKYNLKAERARLASAAKRQAALVKQETPAVQKPAADSDVEEVA